MTRRLWLRAIAVAVISGLALGWPLSGETAGTPLLPNLKAQPASQLSIQTIGTSRFLRFSTTTWNAGDGPVELNGGEIDQIAGKQRVQQRVYNSDGTFADYDAGTFQWHIAHAHIHFDDYALYTLQALNAPGGSTRTASKTTFCIIDTTKISRGATAPKHPVYTTCGQRQGMSVGWGDTYTSNLAGQEMNIDGLPDGDYRLTIEADWKNHIIESNDGDNLSSVDIRIAGNAVTVLGGRGHKSQ